MDKCQQRQRLQTDVERYLKNGGTVRQLPAGRPSKVTKLQIERLKNIYREL